VLRSQRRVERGSALVLVPVIVVIMVFAAGMVIDSAVAFGAKRALVEAASAAANDAANALADDPLYAGGGIELDRSMIEGLAAASIQARTDGLDHIEVRSIEVSRRAGRPTVRLTVAGRRRPVVGVLPGVDQFDLVATVTSTAWERS
jgi:hypothetical protein